MHKPVIYHNPRCSKSRETLALLEERGLEPEIVRYLDTPPGEETLRQLAKQLGVRAHDMIRSNEDVYRELGLGADSSEDELFRAMAEHPVLLQRPIVVAGGKARIGRPPEAVLEIL
ncbi:MAG TPA: arsenate reductase (glutaredoxin) [Gammaproteobacteria bacterium]|nr:arsenate reductase (glutaredoxin) [Gammaproteobacteria bacterium]